MDMEEKHDPIQADTPERTGARMAQGRVFEETYRSRREVWFAVGLDHGVGHPSDSCPRWKHLTH
jgi:hypothetical protein